jgi:outer membrane protein OmpA-like peptidoglycan-associated protein
MLKYHVGVSMNQQSKHIGVFASMSLGLTLCFAVFMSGTKKEIIVKRIPAAQKQIESKTLKYFFEYKTAKLLPESEAKLDELAQLVRNEEKGSFEIHGFTDSKGSEPYNFQLSKKRANVIMDKLVERGIDYHKIALFYHGEIKENNETERGRKNNRRIDFVMKKESP